MPSLSSGSEASTTPVRPRGVVPALGGSTFALIALFSMNLLNYVDRYTFFGVGKQVMDGLGIDEPHYGYLSSAFMIVYTIASPVMGVLGDRYSRKVLLALGVGLWSVATIGTAFATGFADMFFWRALLGIGEATYGAIAPALLADLFPARLRGRVIGLYFLALPLGGGLGYVIGGRVAAIWDWRAAFLVVGLPGLLVALSALLIHDPGRGASDGAAAGRTGRPRLSDYLDLFKTPTFVLNTFGMAAVTFATGALAAFASIFYQSVRGMTGREANDALGVMTGVAGLIGIGVGAMLGERLLKVTRRAYPLLAFVAISLAVVPGYLALVEANPTPSLRLLLVSMVLMAMVLGPSNTVTANVVPANRRATGFAVNIFLVHVFGDISSPSFIPLVAKWSASPRVAESGIGRFFAAIGANPVEGTNLTVGMLSVIPVLAVGGLFFLMAARFLPEDQERARNAGGSG